MTDLGAIFPVVGDGSMLESNPHIHPEELQLALRNKAMPLEALRYEVTPTGMHYTLIHYDVPALDVATWRLDVNGEVGRCLSLSLADLQTLSERSVTVTMECAGDGRALNHPRPISQPWLTGAVGTAVWTGVPVSAVLKLAGVKDGALEIVFEGHDQGFEGGVRQRYERSLPVSVASEEDVILAWAMNGSMLEPQHGFPVRVVVPGWYGMANVKWVREIRVVNQPFDGYQQTTAYRYTDDRSVAGEPVTLMRPRSLMVPPGIPDFLTRTRVLERGAVQLEGRAWSGRRHVSAVDVSTDGGATWRQTSLEPPGEPHAWQAWWYEWQADHPGTFELCCRARDEAGEVQPSEPRWNARGMGNNVVHRVQVIVL